MVLLVKPLKKNIIHRFMMTYETVDKNAENREENSSQSISPESKKIQKRLIIDDEITEDPEEQEEDEEEEKNTITKKDYGFSSKLKTIKELAIKFVGANKVKQLDEDIIDGNETVDDQQKEIEAISQKYEKEAEVVDTIFKGICIDAELVIKKFFGHVDKSKEMAVDWGKNIKKLSENIKARKALNNWKKTLIWTTCIMTLSIGILKMGLYRKIPDFVSSFFEIVPNISTENTPSYNNFLPGEKTFSTIMETPLTPLTVTAVTGSLTLGVFTLKIIAKVLRMMPK